MTPTTLRLKPDSMTSHDITCVGISFRRPALPAQSSFIPYVSTNCHNSLCAVAAPLNDDHKLALSAASRHGGIYVPATITAPQPTVEDSLPAAR